VIRPDIPQMPLRDFGDTNVRIGSKPEEIQCPPDVCFALNSDQKADIAVYRFSANFCPEPSAAKRTHIPREQVGAHDQLPTIQPNAMA
jgi:hypothetical protein